MSTVCSPISMYGFLKVTADTTVYNICVQNINVVE